MRHISVFGGICPPTDYITCHVLSTKYHTREVVNGSFLVGMFEAIIHIIVKTESRGRLTLFSHFIISHNYSIQG